MPISAELNAHAIAVMLLTGLALFLFTRKSLPLESSSLAVLAMLAVGFELFPFSREGETIEAQDFFSGFGHEALVAVIALLVIGHGLARTGALEPVGRGLAKLWTVAPRLSFLATLVVGAVLSAFVNNVPIVILLLPILASVSLRTRTPASGILMPMGFATLVGGMATTIGTSTNLLVVSVAVDMGLERFSMFEFLAPVAVAGALAILYLWLLVPRILPQRKTDLDDASPRVFAAALHVDEESWAVDKSIEEIREKAGGMKLNYLRRSGEEALVLARPEVRLRSGDQLLVNDTPEKLKEFEKLLGARLWSSDRPVDEEHPLQAEGQQLAELIVTQGSPLENNTLAASRFADRYQLATLALHRAGRHNRILGADIAGTVLEAGDVLLVQGASEQITDIKKRGEILVLDATTDLPYTEKAPLALAITVAAVALAAFGVLPIAITSVCGVVLMALTRCLSWKDVGQAINGQIILVVAASLALGFALLETGAAGFLAAGFVTLTADSPVVLQLSGLMLLMAVLTNIVSNNAAAVIGTPIAIGIAGQLGLAPEPFVLAVLFGANMSYATPMAYKTNLLVMTVGGYTFNDFLKVGIPLTLIMWLSLSWLIPVFYDLG